MPALDDAEAETSADLIMVAGISGIRPDRIKHYTLFVVDEDHDGWIYTSACCAYHAGKSIPEIVTRRLAAMAPCRGHGG